MKVQYRLSAGTHARPPSRFASRFALSALLPSCLRACVLACLPTYPRACVRACVLCSPPSPPSPSPFPLPLALALPRHHTARYSTLDSVCVAHLLVPRRVQRRWYGTVRRVPYQQRAHRCRITRTACMPRPCRAVPTVLYATSQVQYWTVLYNTFRTAARRTVLYPCGTVQYSMHRTPHPASRPLSHRCASCLPPVPLTLLIRACIHPHKPRQVQVTLRTVRRYITRAAFRCIHHNLLHLPTYHCTAQYCTAQHSAVYASR